tara:strand:+ start:583 stop:807 length:225 start_codon:yes stop_codon:yes gene_type:complete
MQLNEFKDKLGDMLGDKHINIPDNLIAEKGLTEKEVVEIVRLWYINGMYADILQNEQGQELDEVCADILSSNVR